MKWVPTLLVLAVVGVLFWITNSKPSEPGENVAAAAPHGTPPTTTPAAAAAAPAPGATNEEAPPIEVVKAPAAARPAPAPRAADTIVAQVKDPQGRGVAQIEVTLLGADGKPLSTRRTDAEGRSTFENVAAGSYTLAAADPDYLYTASGTTKVTASKGATTDAQLRVERGGASVAGTLVDGSGAPIAEKPILLTAGGASFSVNSDARGRFRVSGLVAGDWKVAPRDFPSCGKSVRLEQGAAAQVELTVPRPASLEVTLSGSQLHRAFFKGDERALLRAKAAGGASGTPTEQKLQPVHEPVGEHRHHTGESASATFAGLAPGDYEVELVDGAGKSLISIHAAWAEPLPVTLREGEQRLLPAKTAAALRGSGVEVPMWTRIFMFAAIGLMIVATPVLFPPPLVPKRPARAPAKS